jgi:thymidylate kinase
MKTKILCLEGITGAGKTTQANKIGQMWCLDRCAYLIVNEKEYEPFRQTIINWHKLGANQNFNKKQIQEIAKARGETHKNSFIPMLNDLDYLLFDRSFYTSAIYQADGGLNSQEIINLNLEEGTLVPEKGVILTCSPEIARKRIDERRKKFSKYNLPSMHESLEEISKRRELYIELARQHTELYLIDTTNKTEDEVFEEVKFGLRLRK